MLSKFNFYKVIGKKQKQGSVLLEVVIGAAIMSASLLSLMSVFNMSLRFAEQSIKKTQASFLLEEGMEVVRILRDSGWHDNIESLDTGTPYYLDFSEDKWIAASTADYIDGVFDRVFILNDVYRDSNYDIVDLGGDLDTDTRKITVAISWFDGKGTTKESIHSYITNIFDD